MIMLAFVVTARPQTTEYLQQKDFRVEKQKLVNGMNATRKQVTEIQKNDAKLKQAIDSLTWKLGYSNGKLGSAVDSLSKTNEKLNALQEKVDSQKSLSRGVRILLIVLVFLLFAVLFILVFLFKRNAGRDFQSVADLDRKTNERIGLEIKNIRVEIQNIKDHTGEQVREMNQRISAGLGDIESKSRETEHKFQDMIAGISGKVDIIGPEVSKLRETETSDIKKLAESIAALKGEFDRQHGALAVQAAKLEEEIKSAKGKQ